MKTKLFFAVVLGLTLSACSSSKKDVNESSAGEKVEEAAKEVTKTAQEATSKAKAAVSGEATCKLGGDTRTIAVNSVDKGCEVIYTKFGEPSSIASGSSGSDHCVNVVSKVRENLENAGFKCE